MAKTSDHFIVILCGGTGPRLWPLSRADFPKQFLKINSSHSLLQQTILRTLKVVPPENVYIISNAKYIQTLNSQTKNLIPSPNILTEPEKKNTTAAIIYASSYINHLHPNCVITSIPADHFISQIDNYVTALKKCSQVFKQTRKIVAIGYQPTFANPSYGYIISGKTSPDYFPVKKFIEKPDPILAARLIKQKALWNMGYYTFDHQTLMSEMAKYQKDIFNLAKLIINRPGDQTFVNKFFHQVPSIAFDIAISEKTSNLIALKANFKWSDIGEWKTIYKILSKTPAQIVKLDKQVNFVSHNSQNCLVSTYQNKLIGLVGVKDLAIIDTPDGLLVCNLSDSFEVRDLIAKIVSKKSTENYFLKSYDPKSSK